MDKVRCGSRLHSETAAHNAHAEKTRVATMTPIPAEPKLTHAAAVVDSLRLRREQPGSESAAQEHHGSMPTAIQKNAGSGVGDPRAFGKSCVIILRCSLCSAYWVF